MSDEARYWHRLRINGAVVDVAGEVTQQESLEQMDALSATCRIAGTPTVSEGQTADLYLVDLAAGTGVPQLSGEVDLRRAVGRPHEQHLILVGQLGKTTQVARRQADGDLLLGEPGNPASLTDGEAVEAILTYCGIAFTPADIQDAGHVLGAKKAVYWRVGVAAADLIADLDRVFQMRTVVVGAGRVVRFRYDAVPQLADAVATYERGASAFFFNAERERGLFREIRYVVDVTGVAYDCGDDDSCSCRITAHAEADNADLGAGVRTVPYSFASELIQSTGVAEEVAKDLMRRLNRKVDRVACFGENDPNQTVGKVISVTDAAAGIDLATATAYQIFAVQRTGNRMRLDCHGGAAGATGTVTSSIEQVCQDASFALPPDPSFAMPSVTFPPVVGGVAIPDLPGSGGEDNPNPTGEIDLLDAAHIDRWTAGGGACVQPGTTTHVTGVLVVTAGECGAHDDVVVGDADDWRLTFTAEVDSAAVGNFNGSIGITSTLSFSSGASLNVFSAGPGFEFVQVTNDAESDVLDPTPFAIDDPFDVTLERSGASVAWQIEQGASSWSGAIAWDGATGLALRVHADAAAGLGWRFSVLTYEEL